MWRRSVGVCSGRPIAPRRLHSRPDNLEELLDKHVSKKPSSQDDAPRQLTSTRREALCLYRDIMRASRYFVWRNAQGMLWKDVLRASARKEFEEARFEKDPEIIARLLVGGRDALQQAVDKAVSKQTEALQKPPNGSDR